MENKDYIIKLKDGGIEYISSDEQYIPGCPTCNYGAEYINNLYLTLTAMNIQIETTSGNGYILSVDNIIKLFAKDFSNMTETEFSEYLKKSIQDISDNEISYRVIER